MYVVVDERQIVTAGYVASFDREGVSSLGLDRDDFRDWLEAASRADFEAVQGFLLGEFQDRLACTETIRRH
ncbi:DNA-binding response regulator, partial [Microvirga sp. 2TAF3]